jgi:hypothetical protein
MSNKTSKKEWPLNKDTPRHTAAVPRGTSIAAVATGSYINSGELRSGCLATALYASAGELSQPPVGRNDRNTVLQTNLCHVIIFSRNFSSWYRVVYEMH